MATRQRSALGQLLFDPNAGKEKLRDRYDTMCSPVTTLFSREGGVNRLTKAELERYSHKKREKTPPLLEQQQKTPSPEPQGPAESKQHEEPQAKPKTMVDFWIAQGWFEECNKSNPKAILIETEKHTGYVRLKRGKWKNGQVRIAATKFLIEEILTIEARDIERDHFHSNMLVGLLNYYDNSPIRALREAGYNINEWELKRTPEGFYESKQNRRRVVQWLVEQLAMDEDDPKKRVVGIKKDPREITCDDFHLNRLGYLLTHYHGSSPFNALKEARVNFINGFEFYEWEMSITPTHFHDKPQNRIKTIKWLAAQLALPLSHPEKRVRGVKKQAKDITENDFILNGQGGLLTDHYGNQPFEALYAARLVTEKDEAYMRRKGAARCPSKLSA